ncbi:MAG: hypothetical protein QF844_06695, partial [Acidimicrobiales bacterium]|nr:hypothetical protein [Acidimicrobiales bacterium]
ANHQNRESTFSHRVKHPPAASGQIRYRLMKAGAFEPGTEVEQTLEQRVEALEAAGKAINARL